MTHPSFPTPQHDRDARAIRVDEPSADGRITSPMVGCPVDRGAIEAERDGDTPDATHESPPGFADSPRQTTLYAGRPRRVNGASASGTQARQMRPSVA
jgi:hypothetical protein